jgi:hypothetical protein
MEILDILMGYGPILFSGAVIGAIFSNLAPSIIKKMKDNFIHQRVLDLHTKYKRNPDLMKKTQPELAKFLENREWTSCTCQNCLWLNRKIK